MNKTNNKSTAILTLAGLLVLAQLGVTAAQTPGSATLTGIHGTVTDPSGAVIPGAMVTVSNGQWSRTVSTDEAGRYQVAGIAGGHYRVRVRFGGFAISDKSNYSVMQGQETEADAQLELHEVRQTVTVLE